MAHEWNPNSTGTKGMEWPAFFSGAITVPGQFVPCLSYINTVSETAASARIYLGGRGQSGGLYVIEAYDNETAIPSNFDVLEAQPNQDVSGMANPGWVVGGSFAVVNLYQQIDELAYDPSDWIAINGVGTVFVYAGRFNTAALALTSKRILRLRMVAAVHVNGNAALEMGLNISGNNYPMRSNIAGTTAGVFVIGDLYYNPATKQPWRIADVVALDNTDEFYFSGLALTGGLVSVYWVSLEVALVDENRLAFGVLDDTAGGLTQNAWNTLTLTTPTAGTWTKDGSGYHTYLMRRLNSTGSFNVPYHESFNHAQPPTMRGYYPTLNTTYGYAIAMGSATPGVIPFGTRTSAPADSTDAQPYADIDSAQVRSGQDAEQRFSNAAAANYGFARFLCNPPTDDSSPLILRIKRHSDNVQLGGDLSVTPAQVRADHPSVGGDWYYVQANLASVATLAAATQYYFEFSSAAVSTDPWYIPFVNTGNVFNAAGFGGTTDDATVNGLTGDQYDMPVTISTVPSAPASFAGSVTNQTVTESVCQVTAIPRASLTWSATALGGSFERYELQRSLDGGTTWTEIRRIETEATASAVDYEAPINAQASYRIRVIRSDSAASGWSSTVNVTKTSTACVLYFVSNYDPSYNLVLDHEPEVGYDFLESDDRVVHAIYGVDKHLGFIPIEDRGTRANWRIPIAFDGEGDPHEGKAAFDALRDLARATLPYVMVLDTYGNQIAGLLHVPTGSQFMPGRVYVAEVAATELVSDYVVVT